MCSKPELLKGSLFHVRADLWEDSTQSQGRRNSSLQAPSSAVKQGPWGGRDGTSVFGVAEMGHRSLGWQRWAIGGPAQIYT